MATTQPTRKKLALAMREIGGSHNLMILERCKDAQKRECYLRMTRKFGGPKNMLTRQIDHQSYEKSLLGLTNFDNAPTPALRAQAKLAVQDEYAFGFLELGDQHSERELERAMGGMFVAQGAARPIAFTRSDFTLA